MANIKKITLKVDYGTGVLELIADKRPEDEFQAKIWDMLDKTLNPRDLMKLQREIAEKENCECGDKGKCKV